MQTEAGRTTYRRMHIGETPFSIIKNILEAAPVPVAGLGEDIDPSALEDARGLVPT